MKKIILLLLAICLLLLTACTEPGLEQSHGKTKPSSREYECNIPFDFSEHPDKTEFSLSNAKGFDTIINEIQKVDDSFEPERYKALVHNYSKEGNSGFIQLLYYIGDDIKTNKAYQLSVDNGVITKMVCIDRPVPKNNTAFEKKCSEKVNQFKANLEPYDDPNIVKAEENYYYDYDTGELKYARIVYKEVDGFIVDDVTEVVIK